MSSASRLRWRVAGSCIGAMAMERALVRVVAVAMLTVLFALLSFTAEAQGECSSSAPCPDAANCCSRWGFCGVGPAYCGDGCQAGPCDSGPTPPAPSPPGPSPPPPGPSPPPPGPSPPSGSGLGAILTESLYQQLFPQHLAFYSYGALIEAAKTFPEFGTTGDTDMRKKEIAAFAAHVWQETSGLQEIIENTAYSYCDPSREKEFPCNGNRFYGRGPLQLSWNYNYGPAGAYLNIDLLNNPNLVATDAVVSFKASLWFWNKYGDSVIPRIHSVITGAWNPTSADQAANRFPGFGVTILVINGGLECNKESEEADNRVNFYEKFCNQLGVNPGPNLDCKRMRPFYSVNVASS